jgi:hypothetical protein
MAPGEMDLLMVVMAVFLVVAVLAVGVLFLRLHTFPERIAHKSQKLQFEIVAVLSLLALFTHVHLFWVAGLLLASLPSLCPGKAVRQGNHIVLSVIRVEVGHHRLFMLTVGLITVIFYNHPSTSNATPSRSAVLERSTPAPSCLSSIPT